MKRWFARLKVSQKLMLISIFFVMPDSVMLYLFITGINANIDFARLEKKGNAYQRPLEELLQLIPEHRLLVERAGGDAQSQNVAEELAKKQQQIDSAFDSLEIVDGQIGGELQFTDDGLAKRKREHCRVHTLREEWQQLKARLMELDRAWCTQQHLHLIADLRVMITHAGDMSNLILDPDLDSYYLMDATLLALPQTQDRLAVVMAEGAAVLKQGSISNQQRQQLAIHAAMLQESDLDRVSGSVQTALNEDTNFYRISPSLQERVPPLLRQYTNSAAEIIRLTTELVTSEKISITAEEYLSAGARAREASFELWKVASEEVDTLLQNRINTYQLRRTKSLIVAAFALLAAVGFVTFITRSISGPLQQQADELRDANAALQAEIGERKRAEDDLRRSERQLAAAQKLARIGSWEWDTVANRMTWSDENYRILGFCPRSMEASYSASLRSIHPEDRDRADAMFKQALTDKRSFSFEARIVRPDGTERIVYQCGEVVLGYHGEVVKMFGTAQDITERRQSEHELEKVHKELVEVSRFAGMAEVATGVLHNVGNVLNSVNVSATLVADTVRRSKLANLPKVSAMLTAHAADLGEFLTSDPKGRQIPGYLATLGGHLADEQRQQLAELESLRKNIDHIKDIVAMQQSYAKVSGAVESLPAWELVEDALRMNVGALARHRVEIVRDFAEVPPVHIDKHKVLQILINLIRNSKHSMDEFRTEGKRMIIRIAAAGNARVQIQITDNGMGIPKENLARIFQHGFTTKKDGHGFGLHSGAIAAKELGGSLSVHSDGPGLGATFTLELPASAPGPLPTSSSSGVTSSTTSAPIS